VVEKAKSKEFVFKSKSNPNNSYTAILYADGTTSCNCRGWTMKRSDKERGCRHTKEIESANPVSERPALKPTKKATPSEAEAVSHDVEPMAAGKLEGAELDAVWEDAGWVAEEKLDGARYILHLLPNANRLFSRRKSTVDGLRVERTDNVPHLRDLKHKLKGTILDGEIVVGKHCRSNDVARIMGSNCNRAAEVQEASGYVTYKVFDILVLKGTDLRNLPYHERYSILEEVLEELDSDYMEAPERATKNKKEFFERIIKAGGEGVILKDLEGRYIEGSRSTAWAKVKRESTWNVICTGFTRGKNAFADTFGAIKLSMYKAGVLTEVGQCSGMTLEIRNAVHNDRQAYLGKVLEVTGQEFTSAGRIRHPRFKGWRMDVDPRTVTFEDEARSS
jgi:ATP-dependent DNA ligase